MAPQVTDEERKLIQELLAEGKGANNIARKVGRSRDTVCRIAAESGHIFGKTNEEKARARSAYCDELRQELRFELLNLSKELLAAVKQPSLVYAFGGKDNDYNEHELDKPDPRQIRELLTSAGIAIDKAEVIEKNSRKDDGGKGAMLELLERMNISFDPPPTTET